MNKICARINQVLNEADLLAGATEPQLDAETLSHLDKCPVCREEYRVFSEARQLFSAIRPVEPDPSFGPAWRAKLRQERLQDEINQQETARLNVKTTRPPTIAALKPSRFRFDFSLFRNWQWMAGFGAAVIMVLIVIGFAGQLRPTIRPNQEVTNDIRISGAQTPALDRIGYQLRIVKIGPQKKIVQRIIRDYHRSAEGGASYAFRDPKAGLSFGALTLQQARNLKRDLEKAGAVVNIEKEKIK